MPVFETLAQGDCRISTVDLDAIRDHPSCTILATAKKKFRSFPVVLSSSSTHHVTTRSEIVDHLANRKLPYTIGSVLSTSRADHSHSSILKHPE